MARGRETCWWPVERKDQGLRVCNDTAFQESRPSPRYLAWPVRVPLACPLLVACAC